MFVDIIQKALQLTLHFTTDRQTDGQNTTVFTAPGACSCPHVEQTYLLHQTEISFILNLKENNVFSQFLLSQRQKSWFLAS